MMGTAAVSLTKPVCRPQELGGLMPMLLWLDPAGTVRAAGPTLRKILGQPPQGRHLCDLFELVDPRGIASAQDLARRTPIRLHLRKGGGAGLKGVAVVLEDGSVLVNLSFGPDLHQALRAYGLSDSDFAATDLAFELLYLTEANAAVIAEARKFSERLRSARAQALEQALTDPLTGLRNRRGLDRALTRLQRDRGGFGLIHVDLDHFKQVNDTRGHGVGDQLLQVVADRLRQGVRDGDCVARIGGDEFVVLLPGMRERARIGRIARRLLSSILRPFTPDPLTPGEAAGEPVQVSASLGVAVWDGQGPVSAEVLLELADRALYRSKESGRGRITFDAAI